MHWQSYHRKLLALAETGETLTTSQQAVCEFLHQAIEDYQQRINLWGSPGVGKTFLAHYLHYCAEGLYFFSPENCPSTEISPNSVVIVDNAPSGRSLARSTFGNVLWAGASSVILVTRQPIDDAVWRIELALTDRDRAQLEGVMRKLFAHLPLDKVCDFKHYRSGIWERLKVLAEHSL
ncbi:MAG: hypothetical protein F4W91_22880 [Gemmatimonadetes bacterium]|nr:hypothetical protein [Gemmatimonadota bacterium]